MIGVYLSKLIYMDIRAAARVEVEIYVNESEDFLEVLRLLMGEFLS
jgi:hypothetical protein